MIERERIAEALAQRAAKPDHTPGEYKFYAVITKQSTIKQNVVLTLEVPWEHRHQVFKALETMPFSAMVTMNEVTNE